MFDKIFISVDMEGISGIVHGSETGGDPSEYEKARKLMVGDVNAAIKGIMEAGGAEVVVSDGHGGMRNILPEELHGYAVLVRGSPKPLTQMSGIDESFDAALFVGYHSKKGTRLGILSHTISGRTIESITINGREVGETGINGGIAGYYGVPLIFVSGDMAVTEEARDLNPDIKTVAVKEAVSRTAAKILHPEKARRLITRGVREALEAGLIDPIVFDPPLEADVRYVSEVMADAVDFMPSADRLDGKTIRFAQDDYIKLFGAIRASIYIAVAVSG